MLGVHSAEMPLEAELCLSLAALKTGIEPIVNGNCVRNSWKTLETKYCPGKYCRQRK